MNLDLADGDEGRAWLGELDGGASWRDALEHHLVRIDLVRAERTMQLVKEGRGAWTTALLPAGDGSRRTAWILGNALSGTVVALGRLGFDVRAFDPSEVRAAIAAHRDRRLSSGRATFERWTGDTDFGGFAVPDVAIVEGPVPRALGGERGLLAALRALGAGTVAQVGDNRYAYKRSTGVRADLHVLSPWRFGWNVALGRERSLRGWRRAVGGGRSTRAAALYPHRWDHSLVVGLDGEGPQLFLGPGERTNRVKMLGHRLGLFPVFTPSFAVASPAARRTIAERLLDGVGEAIGTDPGRIEHFVATRGSNALLLTTGGLAVRVPMGPDQERQTRRHGAFLERLARGRVPVPQLVFQGRVEGVFVQVEERLPGVNAAQLVDERDRVERTLPGSADLLVRARTSDALPLGGSEVERLVGERAEIVAARAANPATAAALRAIGRSCAIALRDLAVPRVFLHADLRAKHVQVRGDGTPLAFLDLGCARERDLPFVDLLNLVLHDRKDDTRTDLGTAWREALARRLPEPMERVLEGHAAALGLSREYTDAIRAAYPLFVGHAAEACWDYSRPRWIHRQLGI